MLNLLSHFRHPIKRRPDGPQIPGQKNPQPQDD